MDISRRGRAGEEREGEESKRRTCKIIAKILNFIKSFVKSFAKGLDNPSVSDFS